MSLVKENKKATTLAIGDGANDVGMIKGEGPMIGCPPVVDTLHVHFELRSVCVLALCGVCMFVCVFVCVHTYVRMYVYMRVFCCSPQLLILEWVSVVGRGDRPCLLVTTPLGSSGLCAFICLCVCVCMCVRACVRACVHVQM